MAGFRITYATMSADNEGLHEEYDAGIEEAKAQLGATIPVVVNGEERPGEGTYELRSPMDSDILLAHISQATRQDVEDAIASAKAASLEWDRMGWRKRVDIINNAADLISERRNLLSALMAMEVGKNRLEALGDVEETADLMRWNAKETADHDGFKVPMQAMGAKGDYYDVLRPYGVWAVDQPVQLPDGAVRRSVLRRARGRERGGLQTRAPGRVARLQAVRDLSRCGCAGRRLPLHPRSRIRGR